VTEDDTQLRQALRDLAEEGRSSTEPLDAELLVAYTNDQLSEAEAERVRDHLVGCPQSRALLRELVHFPETQEGMAIPDEVELEGAWRKVRSRISPPEAPRVAAKTTWIAVAAGLALACVGLGIWGTAQQRTVRELSRPVANVVIEDLYPIGDPLRQRETAGLPALELGETTRELVLVLHSIEARPGLRARLYRPKGRELWNSPALEVEPEGTVVLAIPSGSLSPGAYSIALSDDSPGERPQLYAFEIRLRDLPAR
jgi:hypothetical protein